MNGDSLLFLRGVAPIPSLIKAMELRKIVPMSSLQKLLDSAKSVEFRFYGFIAICVRNGLLRLFAKPRKDGMKGSSLRDSA